MPLRDPVARAAYHKEYMQRRYHADPAHRERHIQRVVKNDALRVAEVRKRIEAFRADGCLLCTETEPAVLQAHHLDPGKKDFNIGNAFRKKPTRKQLDVELAKCVCVCANCHIKIHRGISTLPARPPPKNLVSS